MNISSIQELKQQLVELQSHDLIEICVNLAKFKNDNKEYLNYLLFYEHNKPAFVEQVKAETDTLFSELSLQKHLYYAKKGLRRIQRVLNKYCRYMDDRISTIEVHLYFC